jgi:hypothetical protein
MLTIFVGFIIMVVLFAFIGLIRNFQVYRYRMNIIDYVYSTPQEMNELIDIYNSVSYNEMLYTFWKPLDSFYKGTKLEGKV